MHQSVIQKIEQSHMIAILRGYSTDTLLWIGEALLRGGVDCIEITYDARGIITEEQIADQILQLKNRFGADLFAGAGTVLTPRQVHLTRQAGGQYIISPNVDPKVITETVTQDMVSIPGALTPTECVNAWNAGADFVKLFPVSSLGAGYVKAITAPLSHIRFLAVGGVSPSNLEEYVKAGVCGIGTGGDLIPKAEVAAGNYDAVTRRAKEYMDALAQAFGGK